MSKAARLCVVCNIAIAPGFLMCRDDWHNVPRKLQREVNRNWRAFRAARASGRLPTFKVYRAAVAAAIKAVKATRPWSE